MAALEVMDNIDSYVADPRNRLGVEMPKFGIVYMYNEKGKYIVHESWEYNSYTYMGVWWSWVFHLGVGDPLGKMRGLGVPDLAIIDQVMDYS